MPPTSDAHQFREPDQGHPIDRQRLSAYLRSNGMRLGNEDVRQFATGLANINYRIVIDDRQMVLRRPPDGDLPPGAHDMKREHHVLARLHKAHWLAPAGLHLCQDTSVIGVPFQIIEYRPGLVIKGSNSAVLTGNPDRCAALAAMLVQTLASIHAVDVETIGLGDFGRPEGFIERAVSGWRGRADRLETVPSTTRLAHEIGDWLLARTTIDRSPTLLHGDFKLDNLILDPQSLAPRAVVDWDMSTRGDPLFDLATLLSYWTERDDPDCMHRLNQMPTALPGFPRRDAIVSAYAGLTGIDVSDILVLRVLAMYKLAVVFLQLHALYGTGPGARAEYQDFDRLGEELFLFTRDVLQGRES